MPSTGSAGPSGRGSHSAGRPPSWPRSGPSRTPSIPRASSTRVCCSPPEASADPARQGGGAPGRAAAERGELSVPVLGQQPERLHLGERALRARRPVPPRSRPGLVRLPRARRAPRPGSQPSAPAERPGRPPAAGRCASPRCRGRRVTRRLTGADAPRSGPHGHRTARAVGARS